jgi:hypothetical protein
METQANKPKGGFKSTSVPGHKKAPQGIKDFTPGVTLNDVTKLPSQGKAYPPGVSVRYRPFIFGEVYQISESKFTTREAYDYILTGVEVEGMDKLDLTLADVMYIGLLRKISTMGSSEIIAKYHCTKCGRPSSIVFKTTDIEFEDMQAPKLPIEGTFTFGKLKFSPITLRQYYILLEKGKPTDPVALYAVQSIGTEFDATYKTLFNVSTEDTRLLLEIDRYLNHGLKPLIKACPQKLDDAGTKCGARVEIELDGGQALLLPFRTDEQSTANRIRFGVEDER